MAQEIVSLLLHFKPGVSEDIIIAFYAGYFLMFVRMSSLFPTPLTGPISLVINERCKCRTFLSRINLSANLGNATPDCNIFFVGSSKNNM